MSRSVAIISFDYRPPGPMILGAQAPGKVGHRQLVIPQAGIYITKYE